MFPRLCTSSYLLFLCLPSAQAYLGDFEAQDGYLGNMTTVVSSLNLGADWQDGSTYIPAALNYVIGGPDLYERAGPDVVRYNSGAYGTNNGGPGGSATDTLDSTGLWRVTAGGALTVDGSNGSQNFNYITAHGGDAYSGSNFLAIRAIDATLNYDYYVDSRDLGGVDPLIVADGVYEMSFWFCPGQVISPGGPSSNIFGLSYLDDFGTNGVGFGYNGQGAIQYEFGGSGIWNTSGVTVGANGWSQATITFDTTLDVASMSVAAYDDLSSSIGASVNIFSNQAMGVNMGALSSLNWRLEAGMDKNFFDNVAMSVTPVPEPGGALLLGLVGLRFVLRRRSRC